MAEPGPAESAQQVADELYGLPLRDFTKARDEHARRLRREGRREDAEAVKALRKPTLPAWALNQLARRRPEDVRELLATGTRMREGQEALLAGGDRSSLQRASAEERRLVDELTRAAAEIVGKGGEAAAERIRSTLHAAALDEQTASDLEAGRLVREREAVGLFGAAPAAAGPAAGPAKSRPAKSRPTEKDVERRRSLEQDLSAARAEERRAQRDHAGARKAAEQAERRAKDAQRRVDLARTRAEEARTGLREAERRERDAATASERAARAVRSAEQRLGQ